MSQRDREPQIIVSRSHPNLIRGLFELEIPEVHNGVVELKALAREAGRRTKVAVATVQENVDPVGSCLGPRGIRLQSIINELHGEKIDVIQWHPDPAVFIANALSPSQVASLKIDEETNTATVVVPDKQLSLAIGKEGQNARLAAKLTGWRIDIKSVSAIEALAREAGRRTKVAVATVQENVDPVGSCLGPRGIRLQSIINELHGEKIDVIQWHPDPAVFIANALSPSQVASLKIDEETNTATVVVPDKQLSLAIGKEGQNARLAAKLTGWRIDIKSVSAIEAERTVIPEPEKVAKVTSPKTKKGKPPETEPAEEIETEEPVEIPGIPEAPSEKLKEKQIRFAEDILVRALKAKAPAKPKTETKGKRKGKVLKYKKEDEPLVDDESEE